jgi:lipid-A-disaccharide synthase
MIVVYKVSWLNWRLFRWMIKVDYFGLVNLIARREIVPELIQNDFTGNRLYELIIELLGDNQKLERIRKDLDSVREQLGADASRRAARAVLQTLDGIDRDRLRSKETKPVVAPV